MSAISMGREMSVIQKRTWWAIGVSVGAHVLLFCFLTLYHQINPGPIGVTEITWLEPGDAGAAAAAAVAAVPRASHERGFAVKEQVETVHFAREESPQAAVSPDPQDPTAIADRLSERLASLQRESRQAPVQPIVVAAPVGTGLPGGAGTGLAAIGGAGMGGGSGPAGLNRGGGGGGDGTGFGRPRPIEMKRSAERPPVPVVAAVPHAEAPPAPAQHKREGIVAERTLAGATLSGPVADRRLVSHAMPRYPEWAKRDGTEATVRLTFVVTEAGIVKENIVVQKTSGYDDFDSNAIDALRTWRFEPLQKDAVGEQWGEITFRYRLSDTTKG